MGDSLVMPPIVSHVDGWGTPSTTGVIKRRGTKIPTTRCRALRVVSSTARMSCTVSSRDQSDSPHSKSNQIGDLPRRVMQRPLCDLQGDMFIIPVAYRGELHRRMVGVVVINTFLNFLTSRCDCLPRNASTLSAYLIKCGE